MMTLGCCFFLPFPLREGFGAWLLCSSELALAKLSLQTKTTSHSRENNKYALELGLRALKCLD